MANMEEFIDDDIKVVQRNPVREYIHKFYTPMKQTEDEKWTSFYISILVAGGMDINELHKIIVTSSTMILKGLSTLEYEVNKFPEDTRPKLEKLFKIGARTGWTFMTINELVTAKKESREPVLLDFPTF